MYRKLIAEIIANCPVCKRHKLPAPKPSGQSKGLWAHQVNDLVCADTFFVNGVAVMHFMDLFSGWSLFQAGEDLGPDPNPALTIETFYMWLSIFGGCMRCFFRDQGGEFEAHEVSATRTWPPVPTRRRTWRVRSARASGKGVRH